MIMTAQGIVRLIDFGFSREMQNHYDKKGTVEYMSPQVLSEEQYHGSEADIFALGVCLFGARMGSFPFDHALTKYKNGKGPDTKYVMLQQANPT